ncbi:redoxin domain-containing protein [Sphingobacterium psychroaquaticum]|uniref:redoxin family protein n=1 Tax=Sphingobacterium psychroaquaticum TaxID=561061 RepID=UPI0010693560|nr:redoxin family protein [Sphingobacterium psychroaquaticum]QBQ41576.1 redoxin domain-containing protein [Sphingobacterium psychroaquaticum]
MYKITLAVAALFGACSGLYAQKITGLPKYPAPGEKLSVYYQDQKNKADTIHVKVYQFKKVGFIPTDIAAYKTSGGYHLSFVLDHAATALAFVVPGPDGDTPFIHRALLYVRKKQVPYALASAARMHTVYAKGLLKVKPDTAIAIKSFEHELELYPAGAPLYIGEYAALVNGGTRWHTKKDLKSYLSKLLAYKEWSEQEYTAFIQAFRATEDVQNANALQDDLKRKFPDGNWKMQELYTLFFQESNIEAKQRYYDQYTALATRNKEVNGPNFSVNMAVQLATAYMDANQPEKFTAYMQQATQVARNIAYQKYAEKLIVDRKFPDYALQFAKAVYTDAQQEFDAVESGKQQANDVLRKSIKMRYADVANLLGRVYYAFQQYDEALPYAKQAIVLTDYANHTYNDQYMLNAEKVLSAPLGLLEASTLLGKGSDTDVVIAVAKRLYVASGSMPDGFNSWLERNSSGAKEKLREELKEKMLNKQAPPFYLSDSHGKPVSLESFKGKTVVLDFWATWCGPCLASFPAMDKTRKKYQDDDTVVFLFINTREKGNDKLSMVNTFLAKQLPSFDFQYLFDLEDKTMQAYGIKSIPAKFVIDRHGMIQFYATGFAGQDLDLVNELSAMIDLTKEMAK